MREVILKVLTELENVPGIRIYITSMLKRYIAKCPDSVINDFTIKVSKFDSKNLHTIFNEYDSGSHYTIKTFLDIYDQLDESNKKVIWDYHSTLTSFLLRMKKEQ